MSKVFVWGGLAASAILIAFGIASIFIGLDGRSDVRDQVGQENIVGTEDSTIPGQKVDTGSEAKAFGDVIRMHTLEATGGETYSEMDRFLDESGQPTSDEEQAAVNEESGEPMENPARQIWITSTALTTALNTSYFAEKVAEFSIVMGVALLLTGIGFLVLTLGVLRSRVSEPDRLAGV